jgi:hypothetical protein
MSRPDPDALSTTIDSMRTAAGALRMSMRSMRARNRAKLIEGELAKLRQELPVPGEGEALPPEVADVRGDADKGPINVADYRIRVL